MTHRSSVAAGLLELCRLGQIQITHDAGSLVVDAPKASLVPVLKEGLREYKRELIDLLSRDSAEPEIHSAPEVGQGLGCGNANQDRASRIEEPLDWDALPEPIDCPKCGGIDAWWNALGERRCADCDPPTASRRWLERAKQLRRRHRRTGLGTATLRDSSPRLARVGQERGK